MKKEEARPTPASVSGTSSNTKSISDITTANDLREAISETNNSERAVHTSDDVTDAADGASESVAVDAEANEPADESRPLDYFRDIKPVLFGSDSRGIFGKDGVPENTRELQDALGGALRRHPDACDDIAKAIDKLLVDRLGNDKYHVVSDATSAADALIAGFTGRAVVTASEDWGDFEETVITTNLFGPGGERSMSIISPSDAKVYIAQSIAGVIRAAGSAPTAHTVAGWFVLAYRTLVRRHNLGITDKQLKWRIEHDPMTAYVAAILCDALHSCPEHGRLVMEIAADKPSSNESEDRVGSGVLKWFNPSSHKWVLAEMRDGEGISGPIRDMFNELYPSGSEHELYTFRVNLRRLVPEADIGAMLRAGEIDPRWSLVNGGSMAWHRGTYELKPLSGKLDELGYKGTCAGVYMEDDGTGHAKRVEPPEYDVTTVSGEKKRWNAARDFYPAMFPGREQEGTEAMRQVTAHWVGRGPDDRNAPFIWGPPKGLKSCYVRSLQNACGGNFADLSLGDFGNNKALSEIRGKYGITGEDNAPDERMTGNDVKTVKNVFDQGVFSCDPPYETRVLMRFIGGIIMAGNSLTRTNDRTGAIASRLVPIHVTRSFENDPNRIPDVISYIIHDNQFLVWLVQDGNDVCEDGMFKGFDMSNPVIAEGKQEFMDASDWVRVFMKKHVEELDAVGVDCEMVPALYDAFRAYYAKNVSGHGATVAFDRDFRTSLVKVADELGFTIALDKNEQLKTGKPRRGFYEPELLHGIYRNFTEPVRTDYPSGRTVWRNHDLMRWVAPAELYGNPATGEKGLLSSTIRGVMYRRSALERFEQEGITPAQARAQRRAEKHREAWGTASEDDRFDYGTFVRSLLKHDDTLKVGSDFSDFGVGDDDAARVTGYVYPNTGFHYVVPTIDEWFTQRRPTRIESYRNVTTSRSGWKYENTVLELGLAHDPSQTYYLIANEVNVYSGDYAGSDDDAAPTSTSASPDASTSNETPAQTPDLPSAPADGAGESPASTGEPAPANEPSAGTGAATPPDDEPPAAPYELAEPAPGLGPAPGVP